jgi:hypothetical protein
MTKPCLCAAAIVLLGLLAASCTSNKKLEYCPGTSSVLDAVVATQFRNGATMDAANALYTAKIADVTGSCSFDKKGKTSNSDVDISFTATRASGGEAAQYTVPYFIAVTQSNRVITREERSVTIAFESGATTASAEDKVSDIALVTDGQLKPYDYQILVGFKLTKQQLDYNRSVGIYSQ